MFAISKHWKETYPEASVAVFILRNVKNMREHPGWKNTSEFWKMSCACVLQKQASLNP